MVRGSRSRAQESDRGAIVNPARRRLAGRCRPLPAAARRKACSAPRPRRQQLATTIAVSTTLPPQADRTFDMRVGVCVWEASAPPKEMQLPGPNFKRALYPHPHPLNAVEAPKRPALARA